jgi:hypothetical protein
MYVYQKYPRRLYLNGEVIAGDLHATNSVIVSSEAEEAAARAEGYRIAWEKSSSAAEGQSGGNGDSSPPVTSDGDQGAVAGASAALDEPEAAEASEEDKLHALLTAAGVRVDKRWGLGRLRDEVAKVAAQ